jgi:hypothetical protein
MWQRQLDLLWIILFLIFGLAILGFCLVANHILMSYPS